MKIFPFSAKTAEGLEELTNQIKELFYHGELKPDEEIYLTSLRQKGLVDDALTAIEKVKESLMMDMPILIFTRRNCSGFSLRTTSGIPP